MMIDPETIGSWAGWLFGAGSTIVAAWKAVQAGTAKREAATAQTEAADVKAQAQGASDASLARSNAELAEAFKRNAAEWKAAFEKEHAEKLAYSADVHERAKVTNAAMLKLTEENASLRARTDLTPLVEHMQAQSETNKQVADTLARLAAALENLLSRHPSA